MPSAPYLPLYLPKGPLYRCPGERYDINHSVHLARIASGFPPCRNCPQKSASVELSIESSTGLNRSEKTETQHSLFTSEGVRGVYLNDLDRKWAGELAGAFARLLWERNPPQVKPHPSDEYEVESHCNNDVPQHDTHYTGPLVLVGHDEDHRPESLTGVIQVLRLNVVSGTRRRDGPASVV